MKATIEEQHHGTKCPPSHIFSRLRQYVAPVLILFVVVFIIVVCYSDNQTRLHSVAEDKKVLNMHIIEESDKKESSVIQKIPNQYIVDMSDLFTSMGMEESYDLRLKLMPDMEPIIFKEFTWNKDDSTSEIKLSYIDNASCFLNLVLSKSELLGNLECLDGSTFDIFCENGEDGVVEMRNQNELSLTFPYVNVDDLASPFDEEKDNDHGFMEGKEMKTPNATRDGNNRNLRYSDLTSNSSENILGKCSSWINFFSNCEDEIPPLQENPKVDIKVLVLYTEDAVDELHVVRYENMETFGKGLQNDLNSFFDRSGTPDNPLDIHATMVVHRAPSIVNLDLDKVPGAQKSYKDFLNALRDGGETGKGFFHKVYEARKDSKADFVTLLYGEEMAHNFGEFFNQVGGVGTLNRPSLDVLKFSDDPSKSYSIVRAKYALNTHGFVHEIGHNFGLIHPYQFYASELQTSEDDTGIGFFKTIDIFCEGSICAYFTTIMGYSSLSPKNGKPPRRGVVLPYFSNPQKVVSITEVKLGDLNKKIIDVKLGSTKSNSVLHLNKYKKKYNSFHERHDGNVPTPINDELLIIDTVNDNAISLIGNTYASCQGSYMYSSDTVFGTNIWDGKDNNRFIFRCSVDNHWYITGSQFRQQFIDGRITHCDALIHSRDSATNWYEADWSNNGAHVKLSYELHGSNLQADCGGVYTKSTEKFSGVNIWIKIGGIGGVDNRFIVRMDDGTWGITSTSWKNKFMSPYCKPDCMDVNGIYMFSSNSASEWYYADWSNNNGAFVTFV